MIIQVHILEFFLQMQFLPNSDYFEISLKKGMIAAIYSKDINRFHNL